MVTPNPSLVSKAALFLSENKPKVIWAVIGSILTALIPQLGAPWQGIAKLLISIFI